MTITKLSKNQVQDLINENKQDLVVLDVRGRDELKELEPLPTAVNVPVAEVANAFNLPDDQFKDTYHFEKPDKSKTILVYCKMGMRAQNAGETLQRLGYDNILHYSGVADWYSS